MLECQNERIENMSQLINQLIEGAVLKTPRIISAFQKIKREDFMLPETKNEAEGNYPLPIGYGQTISQPFTVAFMLELLQPQKGNKVLDIGSGSGWTTALLAEIVGPDGQVFAIELLPALKKFGENNVKKYFSTVTEGNIRECRLKVGPEKPPVQFLCSDGTRGWPEKSPFDRILVSAAARQIPKELQNQLKIHGRLVIPVGQPSQAIVVVDRISEKEYKEKKYPGFVFVPLVQE